MKKFIDYLFPEVPEEATKKERPVAAPTPKPRPQVVKQVVKEKLVVEKTKPQPKVESQPREEVIMNNDHLSKSKSSFTIDIDKDFVKKPSQPKIKVETVSKPKKYVPKAAISPIFGVIEERKDPRIIDTPQYQADLNAKNASKIGTIFSPIYGTVNKSALVKEETVEPIDESKPTVLEEVRENNGTESVQISMDLEQTSLMDMLDEMPNEEPTEDDFEAITLPTFEETPEDDDTLKNMINNQDFTNSTLEDILVKPKDETHIISEQETISLFDDNETEEH